MPSNGQPNCGLRHRGRLLVHRRCDTKAPWYTTYAEGIFMAVETSGGHPAMDYAEHMRTYQRFIRWTIGGIVFVVLILMFLATLVP